MWTAASGTPTSYIVEAGSQPGLINLANSDLGSGAVTLTATGVGAGTLSVARTPSATVSVDFRTQRRHHDSVPEMIGLTARALALACRGHHELVLENIALRQSSVRRGDHSQ